MGLLDLFKGHSELEQMHDQGLIEDISERIHMKKLAIQICVNLIGRTISQSEFRVKDGEKLIKTELYYRLNVRPNKNMSASQFWQTVIYKLIHDNECLIIKSDSDDLLIADDFYRDEYGLVEDIFKSVTIKNFTYSRTFRMSDVIYLEYDNENLSKLLSSLYSDYGELFGRLIEYQKLNYQVRSTVDTEDVHSKDPKKRAKMQKFINDMYASIRSKVFAIVPQQKGFKYEEHAKTNNSGNTIDDINKITNGYLDQVSKALGIPPSLVHGEMADVEKHTRNFMTFCIDSLLKKIKDEFDGKFFSKQEYLSGQRMDIRRVTYRNMFDVATAVDKLRSSGVANGHELRDELGMEESDDPIHDKYVITKNYSETVEGGEN